MMDVKEALELADRLVCAKTGKHLNDLEREVFTGSWQGQTYEKIYPLNPQYVEKYVGYKLWRKLSQALGEKVSKKTVRGALERLARTHPLTPAYRIAIAHRDREPDLRLALPLAQTLTEKGHRVFRATDALKTYPLAQIETELARCDYFILLLSAETAVSEIAIEQLRQVKEFRTSGQTPIILPIRVQLPASFPLNHALRTYLQGIQAREWNDRNGDTEAIAREVLQVLEGQGNWQTNEEEGDREVLSTHQSVIPTPVAEPELPKGQVRLASAFYVERELNEEKCYRAIVQPGALIRLKAPRQMGKTSLMARILYHARERGYCTVPLSFQHADKTVFHNLNELLRWFCSKISRKLRLPYKIEEYWTDTYGSKDNCTAFFEDCLLTQTDTPLVLGLDEVDRIFDYPSIADDFFGLLRAWYEEAGYGGGDSDLWEKLRLVVVHSTEVYIPMDINQSPFNVGLPIELSEFSPEQVEDLARRHGLNWTRSQVRQLMSIVGGHPYLVRLAFYHIAQGQLELNQLVEIAPTEAGIYGDHLRRHLWNLQQHQELAAAFKKVVLSDETVELESVLAFKLHSMGLVGLQGNEVSPRFDLYRTYFRDRMDTIV
ncbi:MAG: AAA-like domain-containing protein [Cyanobacteria bacterium P01_E01_bin.42]